VYPQITCYNLTTTDLLTYLVPPNFMSRDLDGALPVSKKCIQNTQQSTMLQKLLFLIPKCLLCVMQQIFQSTVGNSMKSETL